MPTGPEGAVGIVKHTFREFTNDGCPQMAAALAYYTVFALPPLLILLILLLGQVVDPQQVRDTIQQQLRGTVGSQGAAQVQTMVENAQRPGSGGPLAVALGVAGLLFGATGAFAQLQKALNRAWGVEPDPDRSGIAVMLLKRLLSLGMVLVIAFLLLVSLIASAAVSAAGQAIGGMLPGGLSSGLLRALQTGVSLAVVTLLFAAIFKVLPDGRVAWRDVWAGAAATAGLFVLGQLLMSFYLGHSDPGSAYGAAGSLAVLLVWVYYSALILLLGAEFTQTLTRSRGRRVRPAHGAVRSE